MVEEGSVMTCVIEIDTGAIRTNYEYLAKATSARVAGVVKADAYGLGVSSVVSTPVSYTHLRAHET